MWPEPRPVPEGRLPVPPLEADMLPQALRPWLMDIAERACCPPDFAAVGALVAASSLVGCTIGIRPKQHDDWTVIPNLWGAVVGAPGVMKSPMLSEVLKQVQRLEAEAREAFDGATGDLDFERAIHEARRKEVERKIAAAVKTGEDPAPLRAEFGELPSLPTPKRYIVNDATVEKLGELLKQNPRGLLMFRDELMGWLRTLDKEGHENDRAFYLEAWDGKGSYTYDRIGRGTGHIERACLSVLGGIQPGALAEYLRAAVRGGAGADGLMQRFQLLVWPDVGHAWRNVDRYPDGEGRRRALALFQRLDALDPAAVGASCPEAEVAFLHYTRAAQQEADRWREALERQLRSEADHPAIDSHLSKYRSLMPSLALLFHLLEVVDGGEPGAVRVESVDRAVRWCAYLEAHARRAYQSVTQGASIAAAALAKKLAKLPEGFPMPFRARDVRHKGWSGLTEPDEVKEAAEILVDLGWLREEEARTGGRPTVVYHLSPRVRSR